MLIHPTMKTAQQGPKKAGRTDHEFRQLLEAAPDAMVIVNQDGEILLANAQTEKTFGYTRQELLGQPIEVLIPKRMREAHLEHRTWYISAPSTRPMGTGLDLYGLRKDGSEFPVEISLSPMKTEEGLLVTAIIRDVTDSKRMQKDLQKRTNQLNHAHQQLSALHSVTVAASRSLEVNHVLQAAINEIREILHFDEVRIALFNFPNSEAGARASSEQEYPVELVTNRPRGILARAAETGQPLVFDDIHINPQYDQLSRSHHTKRSGFSFLGVFPIKIRTNVIGSIVCESRTPRCLSAEEIRLIDSMASQAGISIDNARLYEETKEQAVQLQKEIVKLKRVEELVRASEERQTFILRSAPVAIYACLADGEYETIWISENVDRLTGYSPDQFFRVPRFWADRIHPDDCESVFKEFNQIIDKGSAVAEYRWQCADGSYHWFLDQATVVKNSEMNSAEIIGTWTDITDQKLKEAQLVEYQDQLRSLASELSKAEERERQRIAADLHDHVIQTLGLARIKLGAIQNSLRSADQAKAVNDIQTLLATSIQDTRTLIFDLSPPVLYDLGFEAALEWLANRIKDQHGISCEIHSDQNQKPIEKDLKVLLFQAVRELLVNVAKHAEASRAEVIVRGEGDFIQIDVKDNGLGFDTSKIRFRATEMSGFGLFSIRERLDHLGGRLKTESAPGHGTSVTITLPYKSKMESIG